MKLYELRLYLKRTSQWRTYFLNLSFLLTHFVKKASLIIDQNVIQKNF